MFTHQILPVSLASPLISISVALEGNVSELGWMTGLAGQLGADGTLELSESPKGPVSTRPNFV